MAEKLTCREKEILVLRAAGYTRTGIAKELGITLSTVKTHLENIYRKLGVNCQNSLVRKSLELGIMKVAQKLFGNIGQVADGNNGKMLL